MRQGLDQVLTEAANAMGVIGVYIPGIQTNSHEMLAPRSPRATASHDCPIPRRAVPHRAGPQSPSQTATGDKAVYLNIASNANPGQIGDRLPSTTPCAVFHSRMASA